MGGWAPQDFFQAPPNRAIWPKRAISGTAARAAALAPGDADGAEWIYKSLIYK